MSHTRMVLSHTRSGMGELVLPAAKYTFNGLTVEPRIEDDAPAFSFAEVARLCGHKSDKYAMKLFAKHAADFPADEVMVLATRTVRGRAYKATFFTALGLYHMALLSDTEIKAQLVAWVVATFLRPYLAGSRMSSPDQVAEVARVSYEKGLAVGIETAAAQIEARLESKYGAKLALQKEVMEQLAAREADRLVASARDLSNAKKTPLVRAVADETRRLADERRGQKSLFAHLDAEELTAIKGLIADTIDAANVGARESGALPIRYSIRAMTRLVGRNRRHVGIALASMLAEGALTVRDGRVTVPGREIVQAPTNRMASATNGNGASL